MEYNHTEEIEYFKGIALLKHDSHFTGWIKEAGRLDHHTWLLNRCMVFIPRGGTVVDAGAYIGDMSIAFAKRVGNKGRILCFEPNPNAFKCLQHNMEHSGVGKLELYHAGLSSAPGTLGINIENENFGMAYMSGEGMIPVFPLDHFALDACHFIKIDCEGMEVEILKGAEQTIMRHKPAMLIEMNRATLGRYGMNYSDILVILSRYGYQYKNVDGTNNIEADQFDMICLSK